MYTSISILFDTNISIQIYILNIYKKKYDGFQKFFLITTCSKKIFSQQFLQKKTHHNGKWIIYTYIHTVGPKSMCVIIYVYHRENRRTIKGRYIYIYIYIFNIIYLKHLRFIYIILYILYTLIFCAKSLFNNILSIVKQ